jgi:hypothetical protein
MSDFIFSNQSSYLEKFYCLKGQEDFIDEEGLPRLKNNDSEYLVAKCIQNKKTKEFKSGKNNFSYFIKSTPNSELYNPINKLSPIKNKRQYDFIDSTCKEKWAFRQVTKSTFDKYINFLNTKNLSWLQDAERDLQ